MKRSVILLIFLVVATLSIPVVYLLAWPAFQHHKERTAVAQAKAFLAKKDFRNASLSARRALSANPRSVEACRIMAGFCELGGSTNALEWYRRIAETEPSTENQLRLAQASLRYEPAPYPAATELLNRLAASAGQTPAYHVLQAERSMRLGDPAQATKHFESAARLEPDNQLHQLNLAVLSLRSTNPAVVADARASLSHLKTSTNLGTVALRWLIQDSAGSSNLAPTVALSRELAGRPDATLDDRLLHLTVLHQVSAAEFTSFLESTQTRAGTNAVETYATCAWMIRRGMASEALAWLNRCPSNLLSQPPGALALVDCHLARSNWPALEASLLQQKWQNLDYLRLAYLSRAASEQRQNHAADTRWKSAVRETRDRPGPLAHLADLAAAWSRLPAQEELLWRLVKNRPRDPAPLQTLNRLYSQTGDTRQLNQIHALLAAQDPKNFVARNNHTATCLLLHLNTNQAHHAALELYRRHPADPVVASTYAYSLLLQGQHHQALQTMLRLNTTELEQPEIALYHGLVLAAAGQTNQARAYLHRARQAKLLPEEKALLAAAAPL